MRNLFSKSEIKPVVETVTKRKPDMIDLLLKMSAAEAKAFMKTMKDGDKMIDNVEVTYGVKDRPKNNGLVWVC
ncbi:hypothetical protein A4K93_18340 [Salmonella enterica subsp. enterica serovar Schwarzengrund]|uniref:Uncharacterized protein n=2 Tax=Salmonella enterica I TaxID=59201 RepID=A0A5W3F286_SALET|nr:hypothetical protein [Salmonella enterica subsp. enterica serovar Chester]EBW6076986.1 hypothetical protein [Salmonella enterica subsp. enterica serovar Schwarzengrund]ECG5348704.1 hypothetical protein [Salmonella enterica subsp. enterica serovar Tennessee]ECK0461337.1 hypothetical protein [Salmonella enterica subsp. enterica serovar Enteritidis]EDI7383640.1 hypothetical protein [Salmonella enterica subsp. enterica serovar Mbandaka]EDR7286596.1 hypothetical protein [Salmonella enterica subs